MTFSIDRRHFEYTGIPILGSVFLASPSRADLEFKFRLSENQWRSLMVELKKMDETYDENEKMVTSRVSGVGYHTTLKSGKVHPTRTSLVYAAALLASGVDWRIQRGIDILQRVIPLQDQNPENKTYGIWSWYLEEPLSMMSPPDWNWADFCSVQLLAVWMESEHRLDEETKTMVKDSIQHAARSIMRRNVSMGYTNIAMMGTYATIAACQLFEMPDVQVYAKERVKRLHQYYTDLGSFSEYNSPTYSRVAIIELTRMLMAFEDEDDRRLMRELHEMAWKHVATHFHAPTKQWSGPMSRCYHNVLHSNSEELGFLEAATGRQHKILDEDILPLGVDNCRLDIHCPETYWPLFFELDEPRTVVETFQKRNENQKNQGYLDTVGTTYLHPELSFGTVNFADFWNQRRPILAYWGSPEKPSYIRARFLHDGYDFCSAIPVTAQHEWRSLTSVVFATDYGDTHVSLDKIKDGKIQAKDMRLRFEVGGAIEDAKFFEMARMFILHSQYMQLHIRYPYDSLADVNLQWEIGSDEDTQWLDWIFFSSENKSTIDLKSNPFPKISFVLEFQTPDMPATSTFDDLTFTVDQDTQNCTASWKNETNEIVLAVEAPNAAMPKTDMERQMNIIRTHKN